LTVHKQGACPFLRYCDLLDTDELSLQMRFSVLQQHFYHLVEIALQFVKGFGL
jgi:hypothetical protein